MQTRRVDEDRPEVRRRANGFVPQDVLMETRADGAHILRSAHPLQTPVRKSGDWLHHWASQSPTSTFIAERSGEGWRALSYLETLDQVRTLAASLLGMGLGPDRPILVLSGAGLDHGLLALAAQYVGIPLVPLAEQYALIEGAHQRLVPIAASVRPGMVFVSDAARFASALSLEVFADAQIVASDPTGSPRPARRFADLLKGEGTDIKAASGAVGPDTVAKILFTSGSTSAPKGVPTTQAMMCVNQLQMRSVWPFLGERPPRIVDWLPWNHVFGGSHNFNMMLANGGSFYIDDGKPTPKLFERSVRNITEISPTIAFNVPVAYALLVERMETDPALRRAFFKDLDLIFYAGASLPRDTWEKLERMAMEERGVVPLMSSSWGMTETSPATLMVHETIERAGIIGVPLPGTEIKLLPDADMRCELRVKGPNVMTGYFCDAEKSRAAFDEEGYLITGDAVRLLDPSAPSRGLVFDGRIAEDFKLATGTWVHVSKLRTSALPDLAPLASDLVITGHDRDEIGALIFANPSGLLGLGLGIDEKDGCFTDPAVLAAFADRLRRLALSSTGSSTRISRALILSEPPSMQEGEMTDKGNINQQKVLRRRAALVERLYAASHPAVIRI